eukprot:gene8099-10970_t
MVKKVHEKIQDIYVTCSRESGVVGLKSIFKYFWSSLCNSLSIVDLAGIFTVAVPGSGIDILTSELFHEFFKGFARVKYPSNADFLEKLLEEFRGSYGSNINAESVAFNGIVDKNTLRVLLKFDASLRRAFSNFCGQSVRVGGILSWEEVTSMSIGMEIDGLISFAGSYNIIPEYLSTQQCERMFREVLNRYPLLGNTTTLRTSILYPQFQFLLVMIAIERNDAANRKTTDGVDKFAKKTVDSRNKSIHELLNELLNDMGISKFNSLDMVLNNNGDGNSLGSGLVSHQESINKMMKQAFHQKKQQEPTFYSGTVIIPASERSEDLYSSSGNQARQSMMLRMEHLFDEIESKLVEWLQSSPDEQDLSVLQLLSEPSDELLELKARLPSKPVVIGDAVPIPTECPESVEQLLEAALAHHNLGSFEESLKFLEAARVQMADIEFRKKEIESKTNKINSTVTGIVINQDPHSNNNNHFLSPNSMPLDMEMYITLCKGNVYQSCGDDEQALLHYMDGWAKARDHKDEDWEVISLNSIGLLAYYNLRYDVALICFHRVRSFRSKTYGDDNADTATASNNEGCCLYCLNKRGESRIRFERSWNALSHSLGHRAPRCITVWKNLEKARRSHAPLKNKKDMNESLNMRLDADRLLMGGSFTIQAVAPPEKESKKKKGKGGGKKKKK